MYGSAAADMRERGAVAEPGAGAATRRSDVADSARDQKGGESPSAMSDLPLPPSGPGSEPEPIHWQASKALGTPTRGRLLRGVQLPSEGWLFYTWDPIRRRSPNRGWRRFGTDRLLRTVLRVLEDFRTSHPRAPRIGVGDLSRPEGGDFGPRFGFPGHASHQNGLDVDIYYPRKDGLERAPSSPRQVDRRLAQELVQRFVRTGARFVFVGLNTGLTGPPRLVQPIPHHDNHLHVRLPPS
jgi:murein endopeptidase